MQVNSLFQGQTIMSTPLFGSRVTSRRDLVHPVGKRDECVEAVPKYFTGQFQDTLRNSVLMVQNCRTGILLILATLRE